MKKEKRPSKYEYWFAGLAFLPGRKKIRLKSIFPDAEEIYRVGQAQLSQIPWLTKREAQLMLEAWTIPEGKLGRRRLLHRERDSPGAVAGEGVPQAACAY